MLMTFIVYILIAFWDQYKKQNYHPRLEQGDNAHKASAGVLMGGPPAQQFFKNRTESEADRTVGDEKRQIPTPPIPTQY